MGSLRCPGLWCLRAQRGCQRRPSHLPHRVTGSRGHGGPRGRQGRVALAPGHGEQSSHRSPLHPTGRDRVTCSLQNSPGPRHRDGDSLPGPRVQGCRSHPRGRGRGGCGEGRQTCREISGSRLGLPEAERPWRQTAWCPTWFPRLPAGRVTEGRWLPLAVPQFPLPHSQWLVVRSRGRVLPRELVHRVHRRDTHRSPGIPAGGPPPPRPTAGCTVPL